jgi:membrane associated rhomboid family serine protease
LYIPPYFYEFLAGFVSSSNSSPSLLDLSRKTEYHRSRSPAPPLKEQQYYQQGIMNKAFNHLVAAVAAAATTRNHHHSQQQQQQQHQQKSGSAAPATTAAAANTNDDATSFSFLPMEVIGDDINCMGKNAKRRSDILLFSLPRQQQQQQQLQQKEKENIMQNEPQQQEQQQQQQEQQQPPEQLLGNHRTQLGSSSKSLKSQKLLFGAEKSSNNNNSGNTLGILDPLGTPTPRMRNGVPRRSSNGRHSKNSANGDALMIDKPERGALLVEEDDEVYVVRQKYGYCSIVFSMVQTIILGLMMWQCGIAPLNINPMVGPYPDALSEWGGKNSILIIEDGEWYRLITPILLHAGIIHLVCNVAVQLDMGCFFEKEWGSIRWMIIYLSSAVGSSALSVIAMPNAISVGSSGAVMGLFGGKLAEVVMRACERTRNKEEEVGKQVRSEQCVGVTCSIIVVMAFSFIPYVDWAAHLGGLVAGLVVGIMVFSCDLQLICCKLFWLIAGSFIALVSFVVLLTVMYSGDIEVAEELRDVCGYYQQYFEDYECKCMKDEYLYNNNGGGSGGGGGRD